MCKYFCSLTVVSEEKSNVSCILSSISIGLISSPLVDPGSGFSSISPISCKTLMVKADRQVVLRHDKQNMRKLDFM